MATIIGLTRPAGKKIMVNADHILYFHQSEKSSSMTSITLVNGGDLTVREDVYEIAYRISDDPSEVEPPDDEDDSALVELANKILGSP